MYNVFVGVNYLISSILMLQSEDFGKWTAYLGIVISVLGLGVVFGFLVPELGAILLLLGTAGGVVWYMLLARAFYELGWE